MLLDTFTILSKHLLTLLYYFQGTFIFSLVKYTPLKFNNTIEYPWWGYALGWWFTLSSTLFVPLRMLYNLGTTPGTLWQVRTFHMTSQKSKFFVLLFLNNLSLKPIFFCFRGCQSYALQPKTFLRLD